MEHLHEGAATTPSRHQLHGRLAVLVDGGDELPGEVPSFSFSTGQDGNSESGEDKALRTPSGVLVKAVPRGTRSIIWDAHYKRLTAVERQMVVIMRSYFDGQLDRVLAALKTISFDGQLSMALLYAALRSTKDAEDDASDIFNLLKENAILIEVTDLFAKQTTSRAGQAVIDKLGIDATFGVNNPEVRIIVEKFHNRLVKISDTTYEGIKAILQAAYDDGLGIAEVERMLRDKYKMFSKSRSTLIARTEMNGMVNMGGLEASKSVGVEYKMWLSAFLPDSRQAHMDADGVVIPINDLFEIDGDLLSVPGDMNGRVGNVANCACAYSPATQDDYDNR